MVMTVTEVWDTVKPLGNGNIINGNIIILKDDEVNDTLDMLRRYSMTILSILIRILVVMIG